MAPVELRVAAGQRCYAVEALLSRLTRRRLCRAFFIVAAYRAADGIPGHRAVQLLIDPPQAPITLKGAWRQKVGVGGLAPHSGDIAVKIAKINPDGTFEGKLDLKNRPRASRGAG